jgi:hypothetical protein
MHYNSGVILRTMTSYRRCSMEANVLVYERHTLWKRDKILTNTNKDI